MRLFSSLFTYIMSSLKDIIIDREQDFLLLKERVDDLVNLSISLKESISEFEKKYESLNWKDKKYSYDGSSFEFKK